jgi:hypothetical protein
MRSQHLQKMTRKGQRTQHDTLLERSPQILQRVVRVYSVCMTIGPEEWEKLGKTYVGEIEDIEMCPWESNLYVTWNHEPK